MYNELTKNDIKKMEEEIEYRKLVVRKGGQGPGRSQRKL